MLIDIHVHVAYDRGHERQAGGRYPMPEELIAMMDDRGIDKAVVMCSIQPECRFSFLTPEEVLEICATCPDRLVPFTGLDPRMLTNSPASDFSKMLAHYKALGCRGVGEYIPNLPFDDPLNMNMFRQVGAAGLPLTFHIGPTIGGCYGCYDEVGLPRLEKVLKAFPDLILLGHSQPFWAEIDANVTDENRNTYPPGKVTPGRLVELMREYPNLHGDLSAGSGHNAITRDPEFGLAFMEEFQDRLYFGTDIAGAPQETPIVDYFTDIRDKQLLPVDVYEKIAWRNAVGLLGENRTPAFDGRAVS